MPELRSVWGFFGLMRKPFNFKDMIEQMDYAGTGSFVVTIVKIRKLSAEVEALAKDIKENPKKYFKFSVF